jgi:hypothetical protein
MVSLQIIHCFPSTNRQLGNSVTEQLTLIPLTAECNLPDISQNVKHRQVESFFVQFQEAQIGHKKAAHEEESVNTEVAIQYNLSCIRVC